MIVCDANYDWVHMACTQCIIGNPTEAGWVTIYYNNSLYEDSVRIDMRKGYIIHLYV